MRKFKFEFETIRFPLIIMLIMLFLRGFSNTILSDLVRPYIGGSFNWFVTLMEILQYFSAVVIQYLPFIIVIKYLSKKYESPRITLMFIISYIIILTITMVLGKNGLPSVVYKGLFNIQISQLSMANESIVMMTPYRIGLIGAMISGVIVNFSFKVTRSRTKYALLKFIDKDVLSLILTIVISILVGIGFTFIWPLIIQILFNIFEWISKDISNPLSAMVYGFFDKVLSLLDLSALNRETFWNTSLGGSWMNPQGQNFIGDVAIWNAQISEGVYGTGFGRFITPYYIINLFALPGIVMGIYSTYTNKKERRSQISLVLILIIFMLLSDQSLAVETFLVFMAPLLYASHLIISSLLFGLLEGLNLFLGSSTINSTELLSLGNSIELFSFFKNSDLTSTVLSLLIIGVIIFLIYFFLTKLYYKYLAFGLINKFEIDELVKEVLEIVGGIENIEEIDSNPFRIEMKLHRPQLFDYDRLEKTNISRVIETRTIYAMYYGSASTIIRKEILNQKHMYEEDHTEEEE